MNKVRAANMRPIWISEGIWTALENYWKAFQNLSSKNNQNRAANTALHTGGSIPTIEHKKRLEVRLGREPKLDELFLVTHQKKDSIFVDERSQKFYEDFSQKMREEVECGVLAAKSSRPLD